MRVCLVCYVLHCFLLLSLSSLPDVNFPGKLLSFGRSRTQSVNALRLSPRRRSALPRHFPSDRLLPGRLGERRPADAAVAGREGGREGAPSSRLSPGDVPLCGSETPLCWAVCSTQVWTLVSRPCIALYRSSVEGRGGRQVESFLVLPVVLSYFLHVRMMLTLTVCECDMILLY